jgi:hypothetical protein
MFGSAVSSPDNIACVVMLSCFKLEVDWDSEGGVATCLIARSRSAVAEHCRRLGGDAASIWRNIPKRLE